ncbi:hypothetical protein Tco_1252201, partial [Tanacetum coccineum]
MPILSSNPTAPPYKNGTSALQLFMGCRFEVEMLFVNADELETGVEFAAHEEAQESLISKSAVKRGPNLNFEKVNL